MRSCTNGFLPSIQKVEWLVALMLKEGEKERRPKKEWERRQTRKKRQSKLDRHVNKREEVRQKGSHNTYRLQ